MLLPTSSWCCTYSSLQHGQPDLHLVVLPPDPCVNAGAKWTDSTGLPLIAMIANTSLCEDGGCSVIPSSSLP